VTKPQSIAISLLLIVICTTCRNSTSVPYPGPNSYIFPTSKPGFATLSGQLILLDPGTVIAEDSIYLAPYPEERSDVPTLGPNNSNYQANVDESTGNFVLTDIPPGRYAIVVRSKTGEVPAFGWDTEEFVIPTVKESDRGHTIDLGWIYIP
jgi:hypothetical protein